jgi:hypothetical protein
MEEQFDVAAECAGAIWETNSGAEYKFRKDSSVGDVYRFPLAVEGPPTDCWRRSEVECQPFAASRIF